MLLAVGSGEKLPWTELPITDPGGRLCPTPLITEPRGRLRATPLATVPGAMDVVTLLPTGPDTRSLPVMAIMASCGTTPEYWYLEGTAVATDGCWGSRVTGTAMLTWETLGPTLLKDMLDRFVSSLSAIGDGKRLGAKGGPSPIRGAPASENWGATGALPSAPTG